MKQGKPKDLAAPLVDFMLQAKVGFEKLMQLVAQSFRATSKRKNPHMSKKAMRSLSVINYAEGIKRRQENKSKPLLACLINRTTPEEQAMIHGMTNWQNTKWMRDGSQASKVEHYFNLTKV